MCPCTCQFFTSLTFLRGKHGDDLVSGLPLLRYRRQRPRAVIGWLRVLGSSSLAAHPDRGGGGLVLTHSAVTHLHARAPAHTIRYTHKLRCIQETQQVCWTLNHWFTSSCFLFFLDISQYWPKLYMLAKSATENQPEIKPTLRRERNNLRNTHKDPTNPSMPQSVDQHWVKERVWTGSNASRAKWRVESRSMLQMSEEGKEAEKQSERVVCPRDLKGEAWRSGQ